MKVCKRCVIDESFPGTKINTEGLCTHCNRTSSVSVLRAARKKLQNKMKASIIKLQGSKDCDYDAIVAYSGGKDSSYTLKYLVEELKLKCLAITINNGYISKKAQTNSEVFTASLGVDWMYYTPSPKFMKSIYTSALDRKGAPASIKRSSDICSGCINLINSIMIKVAVEKNIPIVAGGYIGGQVPKDGVSIDLSLLKLEADVVKNKMLSSYFKLPYQQYYIVSQTQLDNYTWPSLSVINPMLGIEISEKEIIKVISKYGWEQPKDTGKNSSNCLLNDFGIYAHHKKYGFNPYMQEIAEQVRHGLMSREDGLKKVDSVPSYEDVVHLEKSLYNK